MRLLLSCLFLLPLIGAVWFDFCSDIKYNQGRNKLEGKMKKLRDLLQSLVQKIAIRFLKTKETVAVFKESKYFFILKKTGWVVLFLVIVVQFVAAVLIYGYKSEIQPVKIAARIIPFPIAVVNTSFVTYNDYIHEKSYVHHFYSSTDQEGINYEEIDKQILEQLVENKIISAEAVKYKASVSKAEVDTALNTVIEQNGGKDKVEKVLNDLYGLNLKDFRKLIKTQLLREKINNKAIARVEARHILIRVDKSAAEDKVNESKTKIDGILKEIKDGLDFAEAAKKYSEDVGSAEQGGKLEPFAAGEMVKEFSDVAFKTKVGETADPIRSDFGWHIIKVEGKTGAIEKTFTDWIGEIKKRSLVLRFI